MNIANTLLEAGAILFRHQSLEGKGFRLKYHETQPNAPLSPIYLNLRTSTHPKPGPLRPKHMAEIGYALFEFCYYTEMVRFETIAGLPNAGDPFADAVASEAHRRELRPKVLRFGKIIETDQRRIGGLIEGEITHGEEVVGFDDLITKAHSKLEWVEVVREAGGIVRHIFVLVDREQGGAEELALQGVTLHSFLTLRQMLIYYGETGKVSPLDAAEALSYLAVRMLAEG